MRQFFPQLGPAVRRTRSRLLPALDPQEKRAFKRHIMASAVQAVAMGVILNHEYIAAKGLDASPWQVTILTMIWPVANFMSVFISHWIDGRGCYSRAVLLGGLLRLAVCGMFLTDSVNVLLVLLLFFFGSNSMVLPVQNSIIRYRYGPGKRGSLFGWTMSVLNLVSLPTSMVVGALLDADFSLYRWIFLAEGIFSFGQAAVLSWMARGMGAEGPGEHTRQGMGQFVRSLWGIFRRDREFAWFETCFMLYGIAFQAVLPAIPFFARDQLGLSFEQFATAKGVIGQLGLLVLGPFLGAGVERIYPFKFTGVVVLILAMYPIVMATGAWVPSLGLVLFYLSFAFFAVGIAGINISWNISSMAFAPEGQTATYQGLHITATAIRGLFAPIIGTVLLQQVGYTAPFIFSTALFMLSGVMFIAHYRKRCRRGLVT